MTGLIERTRLSATTTRALASAGLDADTAVAVVRGALAEDLAHGPDVTSEATVPADAVTVGAFTPRRDGVLAGGPLALVVLDATVGPGGYEVLAQVSDGTAVTPGHPVLVVRSPVRGLLLAERTALNLLCHLSGIATGTAEWVRAVAGTGALVRDSRKTLPGLRSLQKYAVRCGGGRNHRMGLGDVVLIKDNHVAAAGSVSGAVAAARAHAPALPCEVEVDTWEQFEEALATDVDEILLDNFGVADCRRAVELARARMHPARLEASGGLTLAVARDYAGTGVDHLAVGALTHSSLALDIGLDFDGPAPAEEG